MEHKYRHWPLALLLCMAYVASMLLFTSTFYGNGAFGPLSPFYAIWVSLGVGILLCVLSFIMVDCHVPETWIKLTNWSEFRNNLISVELPNHYAYYGPTPNTRKYTHHLIITNYELIYSSKSHSKQPDTAVDAKIFVKEYIDSYFPRIWYQQPRALCCCSGKRCCCFGWVGAGVIQRREYLASEILKKRGVLMNVRKNGDMPQAPILDRIRRLEQRNGEPFWDLQINNCEHYANWVMTGEHYAVQIATGPFWELYFLNSIGRVLLGTMQGVIMTIVFRLAFVVLFVWAYEVSFTETKLVYWIIIYVIVGYNFFTYLIPEIAKVVHLTKCCGNDRYCYPCYSDFVDNIPSNESLIVEKDVKDQIWKLTTPLEPGSLSYSRVQTVWPHEGLKQNSEYSMPILPTLFKAFYLFLFSAGALFGGSWIGQGPTVTDMFPQIDDLPISELIMQTAASLGVYFFWYPLMTSSLDYFLWHKPNKIISVMVYLLFAACLAFFLGLIIDAGVKMTSEQNDVLLNSTISSNSWTL